MGSGSGGSSSRAGQRWRRPRWDSRVPWRCSKRHSRSCQHRHLRCRSGVCCRSAQRATSGGRATSKGAASVEGWSRARWVLQRMRWRSLPASWPLRACLTKLSWVAEWATRRSFAKRGLEQWASQSARSVERGGRGSKAPHGLERLRVRYHELGRLVEECRERREQDARHVEAVAHLGHHRLHALRRDLVAQDSLHGAGRAVEQRLVDLSAVVGADGVRLDGRMTKGSDLWRLTTRLVRSFARDLKP